MKHTYEMEDENMQVVQDISRNDNQDTITTVVKVLPTADTNEDATTCLANEEGDEQDNDTEQERKPKAPPINCPEKIVIFLDISSDWGKNETSVRGMTRSQVMFQLLKKALAIFLTTKSTINPRHQYALVLLQDDTVLWYQEFTNDIQLFLEIMADLEISAVEQDSSLEFSLDQIIELLKEHCEVPQLDDIVLPPDYVVRAIFIYGRSNVTIRLSEQGRVDLDEMHSSPYFFFDSLYIHEEPNDDNKCKDVLSCLQGIDSDHVGYVLDISNDSALLFEQVAKLLSHPLQRPSQAASSYELIQVRQESHENENK